LFASDGDRDRFTYRARSAAAVLLRITDDSGGAYDSRFGLDGLTDALSRLECERALGDPNAVPDDVLEKIVEEIGSRPFTEPPRLLNGEDVAEEIARAFPRRLREAGIGGVVNVYVHVDERGSVGEARIQETSGWRELDSTALVIARRLHFLPARHDDEPVAVWVTFPIRFYVR
jgi:TonB family protein